MATDNNNESTDNFIGEWKKLPDKDFLHSLEPGRYYLRSLKVMKRRIQVNLAKRLKGEEGEKEANSYHEWEKKLFRDFSRTVSKLIKELQARIDYLSGKPGGADDTQLHEIYDGLDGLFTTAYEDYVQVRSDFQRENNLFHMVIDVGQPATGLLRKNAEKIQAEARTSKDLSSLLSVIPALDKTAIMVPCRNMNLQVKLSGVEQDFTNEEMEHLLERKSKNSQFFSSMGPPPVPKLKKKRDERECADGKHKVEGSRKMAKEEKQQMDSNHGPRREPVKRRALDYGPKQILFDPRPVTAKVVKERSGGGKGISLDSGKPISFSQSKNESKQNIMEDSSPLSQPPRAKTTKRVRFEF